MPVFNLELKFDDSGALLAVRKMDDISMAANKATQSVNSLGRTASSNTQPLVQMGESGSKSADKLTAALTKAAGKVLALVSAYKVLQGINTIADRGLQYNASLEQSQIGIASLITSMVKLQDAQGKVLEGAEKYQAAQGMAAGLMEKIQQLGLQTTADAQSIIQGFQSIMAPALQAGIALERIPEFAVQGAQALQTLGVPLNQMRTELDAILTGTVNLSQDVLAPKLFADVKGNLKEYIQGLRESGKLEEELFKRFEPYKLALKDTEKTWAALSSNMSEALDKLAGDTSLNYTKAMKQSISEINDLLIDTKTGKISKDFEHIAKLVAEIQDWIGNKIVSSTETLVSLAKDLNNFLGSGFGTGVIETFTSSIKLAAGALAGFATARALAFGKNAATERIAEATQAIEKYRNRVVETANSQLEAAIAERNRQQAFMATARAQQTAATSEKIREAQLARQELLINRVALAEKNLAQATSVSLKQLNNLATSGLSKLVGLVGGPFNAALMTAGVAISALSMIQSDAEKATAAHTEAMSQFAQTVGKAVNASGELTRVLTDVEKVEAKATLRTLEQAFDAQIKAMESELTQLSVAFSNVSLAMLDMTGEGGKNLEELAANDVRILIEQLKTASIGADDFKLKLDNIYSQLKSQGLQDTDIGKFIDKLLSSKDLTDVITKITQTKQALDGLVQGTENNVSVVNDAVKANEDYIAVLDKLNNAEQANVNTLEGALKWLEKRNSQTEEGKKSQEEMAKATDENALATLRLLTTQAQAEAAMGMFIIASGNATDEQISQAKAKIKAALELQGKLEEYSRNAPKFGQSGGGRKTGGGSGMNAENAAEKWKELTNQLAQLEGKATSSAASLDKTLKSIEDTGKAAKKSAKEIEDMKKAFIDASDKKALQDLNKELLQLEGNTRELQNIERQEKTDQLRAKINDIRSLSKDKKKNLLNRVDTAVQNEFKVKDMQTAVDFMKELESLGGDYGESIAMQNQLIEYQATLYRDNLGPSFDGYVAQWERLKILANDKSFFAGLERGVRKFGADYGDMSKQVEQFTTQMGSHISNTLADAFMKGKFSAQDFFSSLISMAAQAASNAFIGQIFSGIGRLFGGSPYIPKGYTQVGTITAGAGGGFSGPLVAPTMHSGGIVGKDATSFRSVPLSSFFDAPRFHSGGGFFRYGEYPAILKAGERVLNPAETKAYNAGQASANSWSTEPVVNVNIINETGNEVSAQGQATPNGMGGFDLSIIVSQVEQVMVARAKQGKSQLMQYQEAAYGMNRGAVLARGRGRS